MTDAMGAILAFPAGMILGSFATVVAHRVPRGESFVGGRSLCPSCGAQGLDLFHEQDAIPVHSCRLVATADEARAFPLGRLTLGFCGSCGFITNTAYDGSLQDYSVAYEETQGFSPRFQSFAHELALRWVDEFDLKGKKIVEIGSGKGEFLATMCELGDNSGIGIDPSIPDAPRIARGPHWGRVPRRRCGRPRCARSGRRTA